MAQQRTTLVFSMFAMVLVLAALDQTILGTALPAIARELHGKSQLSWVFSAYLIASTVVIPLYGKTADAYGRKPMLMIAISLFLIGSLICGLSGTMMQLIVARGIQGAGAGGLMTLTMLAVVDLFPEQSRGKYQGLLAASYGISTMFGPLLGGLLVEKLSWQWAFFINVPFTLIALIILGIHLRRVQVHQKQSVDFFGAALLATALISILLATRNEVAPTDAIPPTWLFITLGIVLSLAFLWTQYRGRHPILPLTLFANRTFSAAACISAASGIALFSSVVFLPIYFQTGLAKSPLSSAWHLFPLMFGITVAAVASGKKLRANAPIRPAALMGTGLMTISFCAIAAVFAMAPNNSMLLSACTLPLGLGTGLLFPLVTIVSQRTAPLQHLGIGTATPIMIRALGGAIGVAILGAFMTRYVAEHLGLHTSSDLLKSTGIQALGISHELYVAAFASAAQRMYLGVAAICLMACLTALALPIQISATLPEASTHRQPKHYGLDVSR